MKHPRAGQAASVVRPPYDEYDRRWWIMHRRRCLLGRIHRQPGHGKMIGRERIAQDFKDDPELLRPPKIRPFDPREDRKIRDQLRKASITQRITAILPNAECYAPTERVEAVASNDEMTVYDPVQAARVDPNATVPIPVYS